MHSNHISFIFLAILGIASAGKQQSITLYESTAANATTETFTHNVRNLFAEERVTKLGSILKSCVQSQGIWMYYTSANYSSTEGTYYGTFYHSPMNGNIFSCTHLPRNITSIRHVGHSDLSISAISFYTTTEMKKSPAEFYFEGYKLILPFTVNIKSYAFTGLMNWIISNNVPIGNETLEQQKQQNKCLDITRMIDNKPMDNNALAYNEKLLESLDIMYIQIGCTGNETVVNPEGSAGLGQNETADMTEEANNMAGPGIILAVKLNPTINNETGELLMIGDKLSLISTVQITNFTSSSCFTIYEGIDFMGNKTCLVPGTKITDEEYGNKTEYTVGSIMVGCVNEGRCKNGNSGGSNNHAFMIASSMQNMFGTIMLTIFVMLIFK